MFRLAVACALAVSVLPAGAQACECIVTYPLCQEVHNSRIIFTGVARSVQPKFLDRWRTAGPDSALPIEAIAAARAKGDFTKLRAIYLDLAGDIPEKEKRPFETATTIRDLDDAFHSLAAGGVRTTFRIIRNYKETKDDDDDDDNKLPTEEITVWTDTGECGIHFQTGETYLVYADRDEETGRLRTSICYRTRRLTDAGQDLDFLSRFRQGGNDAARIEGFVTKQPNQERPTYTNRILSPVESATVRLELPDGNRLSARTDVDGRFWFDGLAGGVYRLGLANGEFQSVRLPQKGCALEVLSMQPDVPLQ